MAVPPRMPTSPTTSVPPGFPRLGSSAGDWVKHGGVVGLVGLGAAGDPMLPRRPLSPPAPLGSGSPMGFSDAVVCAGRSNAGFVRFWANFDQIGAESGQTWAELDQIWVDTRPASTKVGLLLLITPMSTKLAPRSTYLVGAKLG